MCREKDFYVATNSSASDKDQRRKVCRDIVDKLKRKMLVTTKKIIPRQFLEAEVYKELGATNFVS